MNIQQTYLQRLANLENNPSNLRPFLDDLSHDLFRVVDIPPIRQLLNVGQNRAVLEAVISLLILKAANRLSVGNNLRQGQADEIAQQIIQDYPLLSLDDINILLLNGTKGKYGEIYRLDISVIYKWIRSYEEEKAEYVEKLIKTDKTTQDVEQIVKPNADNVDGEVNEYLDKLKKVDGLRVINEINERDLKDAKKPLNYTAKSKGVKYGSHYQNWLIEMKAKYGRECRDLFTGRLIPGQMEFDEWLKYQDYNV